jgi:hypothetical protein
MAKIEVRAPEPVTTVVAGVVFVEGVAQADPVKDRRALAYFRRAGYTIVAEPEPTEEPEPASGPPPGAPSRAASKADWKVFATTGAPEDLRLTEEQAEASTRDQLAEHYLGKKED